MSGRGFTTSVILLFIVLFLAVVGVLFMNAKSASAPAETACTADAMLCPDGTAVGRSGPNCEFAPCPTISEIPESFEASFEIYTNGTKRVFTAAMYHNQSEDAYIESSDPSKVKVKKSGVTWQEFFDTLPFEINKKCLITGTSQTFCTDKDGTLKFFLNGDENPNALDLPIMPSGELVVRYE